jgi:hypothetical protein
MKVFVYYNLHKKLFSVKALEGPNKGRVIAHRTELNLGDVKFKVSEAGRQRVLREQRKNVHAGVAGEWYGTDPQPIVNGVAVTYNPYKYTSFVTVQGEQPIRTAREVHLKDRRITAIIA